MNWWQTLLAVYVACCCVHCVFIARALDVRRYWRRYGWRSPLLLVAEVLLWPVPWALAIHEELW